MESSISQNRKGQTTPGLMLGVGTVLFLFLLITVFTLNYQIKLHEREEYIDKRGECLKIANIINSVYTGGHGTQVDTHTDFVITIHNTSQISVGENGVGQENGPVKIAFLVSEASRTPEEFYTGINSLIDPDWYKICFSDLGGDDCTQGGTDWINTEITNDFTDLMTNLNDYNVLYLESPSIHPETGYREDILNWISQGNVLILAGHFMCDGLLNSNCATCAGCEDEGDSGLGISVWNISGVILHQMEGPQGVVNQPGVLITQTTQVLDLTEGDTINFNEFNYLENSTLSSFLEVGRYNKKNFIPAESREEIAIAYWSYGNGTIYYLGDSHTKVLNTGQKYFSFLSNLASSAYSFNYFEEYNDDIVCYFSAYAPYDHISGDITIRNENNVIFLENATT